MSATATTVAEAAFVVLQIGSRRFALPAQAVVELAPPVRLHRFPHKTPLLAGVILRRGRIVPVYDAGSMLVGRSSSAQRFYLIARRHNGATVEFAAIPVSGECELASGEAGPPPADSPAWVAGVTSFNGEPAEIINFDALVTMSSTGDRPDSEALAS
jgi:chemotaxis signal transduction protein